MSYLMPEGADEEVGEVVCTGTASGIAGAVGVVVGIGGVGQGQGVCGDALVVCGFSVGFVVQVVKDFTVGVCY